MHLAFSWKSVQWFSLYFLEEDLVLDNRVELGWLSKREHTAKVLLLLKYWGKAALIQDELWQFNFWLHIWIRDIISLCISRFCHSRVVVTQCITILDFSFHNGFIRIPELKFFFPGKKTQNRLFDPLNCQFISRPSSVLWGSSTNRFATDHRVGWNDPFL